jgi:hypothetical protein
MSLLKFLRRWLALLKIWGAPEYGGMIHDYANGRWNEIHRWNTDKGVDEADSIVRNMVMGGRDEVYIVTVKCGLSKGYLLVESTGAIVPFIRAFWPGLVNPDTAIFEVGVKCREIADKMGYRRVD